MSHQHEPQTEEQTTSTPEPSASELVNDSLDSVAGGIVGPGGCIPPYPWEPTPTFPTVSGDMTR